MPNRCYTDVSGNSQSHNFEGKQLILYPSSQITMHWKTYVITEKFKNNLKDLNTCKLHQKLKEKLHECLKKSKHLRKAI